MLTSIKYFHFTWLDERCEKFLSTLLLFNAIFETILCLQRIEVKIIFSKYYSHMCTRQYKMIQSFPWNWVFFIIRLHQGLRIQHQLNELSC